MASVCPAFIGIAAIDEPSEKATLTVASAVHKSQSPF
jgi:hypothetical protein